MFVGAQRSCSVDWKLRPQQKAVKQLLATLQNPGELVTLIGTRTAESATRGARMRERGEELRGITFQFITAQLLVAIDFAWSLSYGFDHAFPALREWYEIRVLGKRYSIPMIAPVEKDIMPAVGWYQFDSWDSPANEKGLEDAYLETLSRDRHPERPATRMIKDRYVSEQRTIVYYEEADELAVEAMDATLFVEGCDQEFMELARGLELTDSAKYYLYHGMVKLAKGKAAVYDEMARRAQYWNRLEENLMGTDLRAFVRHHAITESERAELIATRDGETQAASMCLI